MSRGQGVRVAVIDTGIDYSHPDLAANIWSAPAATAWVFEDTSPADDDTYPPIVSTNPYNAGPSANPSVSPAVHTPANTPARTCPVRPSSALMTSGSSEYANTCMPA